MVIAISGHFHILFLTIKIIHFLKLGIKSNSVQFNLVLYVEYSRRYYILNNKSIVKFLSALHQGIEWSKKLSFFKT